MTLFELVRIALDELYQQGKLEYGSQLDQVIPEKMKYLSNSYRNLDSTQREPLDYRDPATRFAYVYSYVAAHGDYIVQVLQELRDNLGKSLFDNKSVRVSCVGGGPGSDILAVLKYFSENSYVEPVEKLTCYLLDREQAWADTWTELDDSLSEGISLKTNFQPLDVTNPESYQYQQNFLKADLFTMSYFISEVHSLDVGEVVSNFWKNLFQQAKTGAYFLYIDNGHSTFNEYFDNLCCDQGLESLLSENDVSRIPRYSEQASELETYTTKFGWQPKLKGYLSYRVMRKT